MVGLQRLDCQNKRTTKTKKWKYQLKLEKIRNGSYDDKRILHVYGSSWIQVCADQNLSVRKISTCPWHPRGHLELVLYTHLCPTPRSAFLISLLNMCQIIDLYYSTLRYVWLTNGGRWLGIGKVQQRVKTVILTHVEWYQGSTSIVTYFGHTTLV